MKKHGWLIVPIAVVVLLTIGITFLAVNLVRNGVSTADQANTLCAPHEGIKELVAPGDDGAYVLCNDGRAFRTKDPTAKHWRNDTLWPWEWIGL